MAKQLTVHEKVHEISENGSTRGIDIIITPNNSALIIDPTIYVEFSIKTPDE
ncbi:hypothetical protein L9F63_005595, partial [Diploptera punctata]